MRNPKIDIFIYFFTEVSRKIVFSAIWQGTNSYNISKTNENVYVYCVFVKNTHIEHTETVD